MDKEDVAPNWRWIAHVLDWYAGNAPDSVHRASAARQAALVREMAETGIPVSPPAEAQPVEPMTGDLLPCPFCGKSNQDRYPCEWLDNSGANVIRCAWCHGAAPMTAWNRRTAPPSAPVGVEGGAWTDADMQKPWGPEAASLRHLADDPALNTDQAAMLRHCAKRIESTAGIQLRALADMLDPAKQAGVLRDAADALPEIAQQPAACNHERSHAAPWRCAKCSHRYGEQPAAVDEAMAFTDAAVDAIQSRMADLGFVVPVRVISEAITAALAAQPGGDNDR